MASGDDLTPCPDGPAESPAGPDALGAVAGKLREAHRRIQALPAGQESSRRAARRLIAVTNAAKHDLPTAARRLDALLADLEAGRYG